MIRMLALLSGDLSQLSEQLKSEVEMEVERIVGENRGAIATKVSDDELRQVVLVAIKQLRDRRAAWIKISEIKLYQFHAIYGNP